MSDECEREFDRWWTTEAYPTGSEYCSARDAYAAGYKKGKRERDEEIETLRALVEEKRKVIHNLRSIKEADDA